MSQQGKQQSILVIDDEEAIRDYLNAFLNQAGYRVLEADNGITALQVLMHEQVDIVITDLVMPEKEGIETIKEIKQLYPLCTVIAMSGSVFGSTYLPMARMLGAEAVIQKPFNKQTMLDAIYSILTNKNKPGISSTDVL
ncbi:MAG TPA: response regulator [Chitinivibrionales bacterium]